MANKWRGRRLITSLLIVGMAGALLAWSGYIVIRQEQLNRRLILKVIHGDAAGVMRQLARGADPNARDNGDTRMTPRQILAALLRSLIRHNPPAPPRPTALLVAAYSSHPERPEILHALLQAGARAEDRDAEGSTALIVAAYRGSNRNMQTLLDARADINAVDSAGRSALMGAAVLGYTQEVEVLLARGANPNLKTQFGRTALMSAAGFHYSRIVKNLLQNHADVNVRDNEGKTALMYALGNGAANIALQPASVVWTPLRRQATHVYDAHEREYAIGAAEPEEHDTVALLLQAGADANTRDNKNVTALQQANRVGYPDLIAAVKQAGAKP